MNEIFKILIGAAVLVLGFFIGNWIANITREEIQKGQKWFFALVIIGLGGGIYGFISGNDFFLFTFFFIAIVASRSLRKSLESKGQEGGKTKKEKEEESKKDTGKNNKKAKKGNIKISYSKKSKK